MSGTRVRCTRLATTVEVWTGFARRPVQRVPGHVPGLRPTVPDRPQVASGRNGFGEATFVRKAASRARSAKSDQFEVPEDRTGSKR